jgi:hypothetical protein
MPLSSRRGRSWSARVRKTPQLSHDACSVRARPRRFRKLLDGKIEEPIRSVRARHDLSSAAKPSLRGLLPSLRTVPTDEL